MKNPNLGVLLRYHRQSAKLSVNDVVAKFQSEYNISLSNKTVYSWETGRNQPPADTLLTLCKMYNITNIMESLGYAEPADNNTWILSEQERKIIQKYRSHEVFRTAVDKLAELE